jgi:arylsulfatase A-like enzyme
MKSLAHLLAVLALLGATAVSPAARKPDVLFIAIDDQNDWIGHLGGHPLAQTPNLDALARRGTTFLNAHCQSPLCNPSRASLLTGLRPTTTGIYGLAPSFRTLPEFKDRVTLPQHFQAAGYSTRAAGKIFHQGTTSGGGAGGGGKAKGKAKAGTGADAVKDFAVRGPTPGIGVKPPQKLIPPTPMGNHPLMDWGVFPHQDEDKGDYQITSWAIEQLQQAGKDEPLFLAVGYFLPHVPCYITEKWYNLYPDSDELLPKILRGDRDDTPRFSWYLHWDLPEPRLKWVEEANQWRNLCRSYLASTSFVDAQIGRLMEALKATGRLANTIVVVWGDHGWHLGEKAITGKNTLWDDGTKVPLIFAGPGVKSGQRCTQPAELLDIYPTLIELCGLPRRSDLEGLSLVPQLKNAATKRDRPAITSHNQGNHGIRSERYRYIRYADGAEEFYDHQNDPHEWHNLAADPKYAKQIAEHRQWLPKVDRPMAPGSASRTLSYDRTKDEAVWEDRITIRRDTPIP